MKTHNCQIQWKIIDAMWSLACVYCKSPLRATHVQPSSIARLWFLLHRLGRWNPTLQGCVRFISHDIQLAISPWCWYISRTFGWSFGANVGKYPNLSQAHMGCGWWWDVHTRFIPLKHGGICWARLPTMPKPVPADCVIGDMTGREVTSGRDGKTWWNFPSRKGRKK